MTFHIRRTLAMSVTAFAMLSAPVLLNGTGPAVFPDTAAMAAKGGNGNGNSGGNGGGNGNGGGGKSSSGEQGGGSKAASQSGNGQGGVNARGKKAGGEATLASTKTTGADKPRNIKAELAGLNSLKRNINGLMNSADPRMAGIRQYVISSAQAESTLVDLKLAEDTLNGTKSDYMALVNDLGLSGYADNTPSALQGRLDDVNTLLLADPTNTDLLAEQQALTDAIPVLEQSAELAAVYEAHSAFTAAQQTSATAAAGTDENALRAALLQAANENRASDAYLTDDIMAWANDILGVGDRSGLIDDYVARN